MDLIWTLTGWKGIGLSKAYKVICFHNSVAFWRHCLELVGVRFECLKWDGCAWAVLICYCQWVVSLESYLELASRHRVLWKAGSKRDDEWLLFGLGATSKKFTRNPNMDIRL